jgi:alkanesulfonate monooxygenase SsuD/methylene tetrahydromethanopterin reductase-like flavin-dependent oxidoreductase (luciferase family)
MRKYTLALVAGSLVMGVAGVASAQDLASAVAPSKSEFMVFTEQGSHALSPTAIATIRSAVNDARGARVTLTGTPESVAAVKNELVRQGVPSSSIVARNDVYSPLPKAGDGLSDAADRGVSITF